MGALASHARALGGVAAKHYTGAMFQSLRRQLDRYEPTHPDRLAHAYFARDIPCSLLIEDVEAIWDSIDEHDDWSRFDAKIASMRAMGELFGRGDGL